MTKSKVVLSISSFILTASAVFATKMARLTILAYYRDGSICRLVGLSDCVRGLVTHAICTYITANQSSTTLYSSLKPNQVHDQPNTTCISTLYTTN